MQERVKVLEQKTELLDIKLSLSLLINNLNVQRDTYKKSLEVILKHVIQDFNLTIVKKMIYPYGKGLRKFVTI